MDLSLLGQSREAVGAASCRPLRSWPLSRRSGRVPALPYPPLRSRLILRLNRGGHKVRPRARRSQPGVPALSLPPVPKLPELGVAPRPATTCCKIVTGLCHSSACQREGGKANEAADSASVEPPFIKGHSTRKECRSQFRGAATEDIGAIFYVANSTVASRRYVPGKRFELANV